MMAWDFSIWLNILSHFKKREKIIRKFYISDILKVLSTCKTLASFRNDNILWRMICEEFDDFDFMVSRQMARNLSWKDMYYQRINNLYREETLIVGPLDDPEYKITIHIYGDGRCFMSKRMCSNAPGQIMDATQMLQIQRYDSIISDHSNIIKDHEIIDVHANNTTILLLCQDGKVLEMIFTPSWMPGYTEYNVPSLIEFAELEDDDRIRIIRSLDSVNVAVSEQDKVFVWTVIHHPETMEIIRTRPLYIHQLAGHISDIYDVTAVTSDVTDAHSSDEHCTRIWWGSQREERFIDLSDVQLMQLIAENHFSVETIQDLTQNISHLHQT